MTNDCFRALNRGHTLQCGEKVLAMFHETVFDRLGEQVVFTAEMLVESADCQSRPFHTDATPGPFKPSARNLRDAFFKIRRWVLALWSGSYRIAAEDYHYNLLAATFFSEAWQMRMICEEADSH